MFAPTRAFARIRNFGVMAHVDAGKTTLSERILFVSGRTHRIGEVHDGAAQLDHLPQERDRGITITAAATTCSWNEHVLNLIDTPGHVDFTVEVQRSLRVLDGAVAVFDAVAGVEPQSEMVWRQANEHGVARLCFVNKMDRSGADFDSCVNEIRTVLGANPVVVQRPWFAERSFVGVVDLIERLVVTLADSSDINSVATNPVPETMRAEIERARAQLVEDVAAIDDALFIAWSENPNIDAQTLQNAIRRATIAGFATPVLCGSALANIGVQHLLDPGGPLLRWASNPAGGALSDRQAGSVHLLDPGGPLLRCASNPAGGALSDRQAGSVHLLDAVVAYLPNPGDANRDAKSVHGSPEADAPLVALAFKVTHRKHGKSTWIRVYSGTLHEGDRVLNSSTGKTERATRLIRLHADGGESVREATPGDIVSVIGLNSAMTGHTICDERHPVLLDSLEFPEPVIAMSIEPCSTDDQNKLSTALHRLTDEDPTFHVRVDSETGQTIIAGMGELHLEVLVDRLATDHGIRVQTGTPKVAYRETITRPVRGLVYRHSKQSGGPGQFAHLVIDLEPTRNVTPGALEFVDVTKGGVVPAAYAAATALGATDALANGPVKGFPLVGCKLTLTDGATHPKDSSEHAFRLAGAAALREAACAAEPVLLEPVMRVIATTPENHLGGVLGLVGSRRGVVVGVDDRHGNKQVNMLVPLAELFGFTGELRSVSQGRASATMTLDGYQPVTT
jgi:elongation factor G